MNLELKKCTKEILEDFGSLKGMVINTVDDFAGKMSENENKVNLVQDKYKKITSNCTKSINSKPQDIAERSELIGALSKMKVKAGNIKKHLKKSSRRSKGSAQKINI